MAWNQPGGQNNPWGRRPGRSGSDLDRRIRDWQRRLESLLRPGGRRGGGGGDGATGEGGGSLFAVLALVALILWLASGFFQVRAAERGVIQRFGRLVDVRGQGWGWHLPWPIETLTKVNVANVNSSEYRSRVLTADINLVDLRFVVQYQLSDPIKVLFRVRDPVATLREVSESALREVVGQSELDEVLVGATRPEVTRRARELIQRTLDSYDTGITVTTVNLTDVQVPEPVIPSQRDANRALADQERFIREAQAYANSILPVARGNAARIEQEAEGYRARIVALAEGQAARFTQLADAYARAPAVTRQRMYIDTIEGVLSRSRKVVLDSATGRGGNGGGNILYLPLDKLMEQAAVPPAQPPTQEQNANAPQAEMESIVVDGRRRGER